MGKMSVRRKLAIATWSAPREGNIYGKLEVEVDDALRYIDHLRESTGVRVSITHLVGKAVGEALAKTPSINGRILWGRYIPHDTVDLAFLVTVEGGKNLAKAKVVHVDQKSTVEVCQDVDALAGSLRSGKDDQFKKSQGPLRILPTWLIRPLVWATGWLTGALGLSVRAFGLERFPFGSCIVTSVGMLGLDEGYVPPTPFARVPLYVLIGAIRDTPVVREGEIVIRKMMSLTATIDHRFMDGFQGGVLAKTLREGMAAPWVMDGLAAAPWVDSAG